MTHNDRNPDSVIMLNPTVHRFGIGKDFWKAPYARQGCVYLIKNAVNSNVVKCYYNLK